MVTIITTTKGMSGLQVRGGGVNRAPKIWGVLGKGLN